MLPKKLQAHIKKVFPGVKSTAIFIEIIFDIDIKCNVPKNFQQPIRNEK